MTDYVTCDRCGTSVEVAQQDATHGRLCCDMCGRMIVDYVNDLFHYSGVLNGVASGHIHLCSECDVLLAPPKFNFDSLTAYTNENS